ncbi:MAG TPA: hypothetical protein VNA28_10650 [Solirubrobacteraceae bacterium]|nr:hypothetical protein [Solirubrobacteraceae bacterium]
MGALGHLLGFGRPAFEQGQHALVRDREPGMRGLAQLVGQPGHGVEVAARARHVAE